MSYHADFWVAVTAAAPVIVLSHIVTAARAPIARRAVIYELRTLRDTEVAESTACIAERDTLRAQLERIESRAQVLSESEEEAAKAEKGARPGDQERCQDEVDGERQELKARLLELDSRVDRLVDSSNRLSKQIDAARRAQPWFFAAYVASLIGSFLAFACFASGINSLETEKDMWAYAAELMIIVSMIILIGQVYIQITLYEILGRVRLRMPNILA